MASLRRSTRISTGNAYATGGTQPHGILTSSADVMTMSTSTHPREDPEEDDDYEPDGQRPAKRSKTSRHGALVHRRSKAHKDAKVSVSMRPVHLISTSLTDA